MADTKNLDIKTLEARFEARKSTDDFFKLCREHLILLEEKLKQTPENAQYLTQSGVLFWEPFHDHDKAIKYLKKAIDIDPRQVEAFMWLSTIYYHDCYYKEAEEAAIAGLKIDPKNADCLYRLAIVIEDYYRDIPRALQYAQQAVDCAPDCPSYVRFVIYLLLEMRHLQAAEFYLEKYIKLSKRPPVRMRNGVEEYYENIVTGRGRSDNKDKAKRLKDRIEAAKKGIFYQPMDYLPSAAWMEQEQKLAEAKRNKPQ